MANSNRRFIDKNGNMFIPMNVEGGSWNENFMTTPKLIWLAGTIIAGFAMFIKLSDTRATPLGWTVYILGYMFIVQWVLRFIIFEEKYYHRMYNKMINSEITTPSLFWNISSVKDTEDGAIMIYSDAKVGVLVKLERDTITGKDEDFEETHYDALSDFYKEIIDKRYIIVQMNLMEQAGNDPRLSELDKLIDRSQNANIRKLMEIQIGYIKNISRKTLFESDYFLVYTTDIGKADYIIQDTIECLLKVMDGAYVGYNILQGYEIADFVKELYGVKYFDYNDAILSMFKNSGYMSDKPFIIDSISLTTGESQKIGDSELNKLINMTSGISKGTLSIDEISIKDAVFSKPNNQINSGISFDKLGEGLSGGFEVNLVDRKNILDAKIVGKNNIHSIKSSGKNKVNITKDIQLFDDDEVIDLD